MFFYDSFYGKSFGAGKGTVEMGQGADYGLLHNYMDAKDKSFLL